jgi:hypothetical protein
LSSLDEQSLRQIQEVAQLMEANVGDLAAKEYSRLWGFEYDPAANNDDLASRLDEHMASLFRADLDPAGETLGRLHLLRARESQATPPAPPPRHAERLLNYVLPRARREEILGDLEEDYYTKWLPKYGAQEARRLYWADAIRSIAPLLWTAVKRSGIIAAILGAADWLRDRLG